MNSAFGKLHEQPSSQVEEPKMEETPEKTSLDLSALPEELASIITQLQTNLEQGELMNAIQNQEEIKTHLSDTERYNPSQPIDLVYERAQFLEKNRFKQGGAGDQNPKFSHFEVLCADSAFKLSQMSYREVYKLRKATLNIRESKYQPVEQNGGLYKASSQGILLELASQQVKIPMFISKDQFENALQVLTMNLELMCLFQIEPVTAKTDEAVSNPENIMRAILSIQQQVSKKNFEFPLSCPLHIFASSEKLDDIKSSVFKRLLKSQPITQTSALYRSPLCESILCGNIDSVIEILNSESALKTNFLELIDISSTQVQQAIARQFAVPSQMAFDLKQHSQEKRYEFQIKFINAINNHINLRVQNGTETLEDLAQGTQSLVYGFQQDLRQDNDSKAMKQWLYSQDMLKFKFSHSEKWRNESTVQLISWHQETTIKIFESMLNKPIMIAADAVAAMFQHICLNQGQYIMQMCLGLDKSQMSDLVEAVPGLKEIFFSSVCPMILDQKSADRQGTQNPLVNIAHEEFALSKFPSEKMNHCYTLKLALFAKPSDSELHDWIIENMDFDKFKPLKLEIMCLLGHYKGFSHPRFLELFDQQVWLMDQQTPQKPSVKCSKGSIRFDLIKHVYSDAEVSYKKLVTTLATSLIKSHEHELFERFFLSMRRFYMPTELVAKLVMTAIDHYSLECLTPIFTLCDTKDPEILNGLKGMNMSVRKDSDQVKVTMAQIQATTALREDLLKKQKHFCCKTYNRSDPINLRLFMRVMPTKEVDRCVQMLMDHKMLDQHSRWGNQPKIESQKSKYQFFKKQELIRAVLDYTSVDMATKFIAFLVKDVSRLCEALNSKGQKTVLMFTLMDFFRQKWSGEESFDIKPTRYPSHHDRETKRMLNSQLNHAITDDRQVQLIRQSLEDPALAEQAADWIGVDKSVYKEACEKALLRLEQRQPFVDRTFYKWEIAHPLSSNHDQKQNVSEDQSKSQQFKIGASRGCLKPNYNYFEGLLVLQKYSNVEQTMHQLFAECDPAHTFLLFKIFFNNSDSNDTNHSNEKKLLKQLNNVDLDNMLHFIEDQNLNQSQKMYHGVKWHIVMLAKLLTQIFEQVLADLKSLTVYNQHFVRHKYACFIFEMDRRPANERRLKKMYIKSLNNMREALCTALASNSQNMLEFLTIPEQKDDEDEDVVDPSYCSLSMILETKSGSIVEINQIDDEAYQVKAGHLFFVEPIHALMLEQESSDQPLDAKQKELLAIFLFRVASDQQIFSLVAKVGHCDIFVNKPTNNQSNEHKLIKQFLRDKKRSIQFKACVTLQYYAFCKKNDSEGGHLKFGVILEHMLKQRTFFAKESQLNAGCWLQLERKPESEDNDEANQAYSQRFLTTCTAIEGILQQIQSGEISHTNEQLLLELPSIEQTDFSAMEAEIRQKPDPVDEKEESKEASVKEVQEVAQVSDTAFQSVNISISDVCQVSEPQPFLTNEQAAALDRTTPEVAAEKTDHKKRDSDSDKSSDNSSKKHKKSKTKRKNSSDREDSPKKEKKQKKESKSEQVDDSHVSAAAVGISQIDIGTPEQPEKVESKCCSIV